MISESKRFLYIHVPKTGGYTIKNILAPYSNDKILKGRPSLLGAGKGWQMYDGKSNKMMMHGGIQFYEKKYGSLDKYFKFSVVRNPWDRLLAYSVWLNGGVFSDEALNHVLNATKFMKPHARTQVYLWRYKNGDIAIDEFVLFEDFKDSLIVIFNRLDIEFNVKDLDVKLNSTEHKHYSEYYTDENIELVSRVCEEEIKMFNYEFEDKR